ncbi:lysosomal-associated transmembrane protein 4B [Anabrus simplex]|uniref:lysosomal-associated transmembrane protein 4B n=1 Tax=Anabrus simplex TaxID=316456 RepID=UPI0035A3387C
MKCVVQKCCYCFPLKCGTIVVGVLHGVYSSLSIAYLVRRLVSEDIDPEHKEYVLAQSCVQGTLVALFMILCLLLVYGACREKLMLLKVWFMFSFTTLVIWIIIYIVLSAVYFATAPLLYAIVYAVLALVGVVINVYGVLIVYSFYNHLYRARKMAKAEAAELEPMSHRRAQPIEVIPLPSSDAGEE